MFQGSVRIERAVAYSREPALDIDSHGAVIKRIKKVARAYELDEPTLKKKVVEKSGIEFPRKGPLSWPLDDY